MKNENCKNCIYHWACYADAETVCRLDAKMRKTFSTAPDGCVRTDLIDISRRRAYALAKQKEGTQNVAGK